jgi:hypothetical protein
MVRLVNFGNRPESRRDAMKVLIDVKVKYFVLLLIFILAGCTCSVTTDEKVSTRKPEKYKSVFCSSLVKKGDTEYPVDITDKFTRGDGKKVFLYTDWYDLEPKTKTTFRWEVYPPNGEILGSLATSSETTSSQHYTQMNISLDDEYNRVPGVWAIKVYVNNHYIFTEQFTILED